MMDRDWISLKGGDPVAERMIIVCVDGANPPALGTGSPADDLSKGGLAGPGRADQQQRMASGRGDLQCPLGLMLAADDLLRPDEGMTHELKGMSAALNRVGNNVNQIARRLNEAKVRGERLSYPASSHRDVRALAGLVFDLADQVQEMSRARRSVLDLEISSALAGLAERDENGAE